MSRIARFACESVLLPTWSNWPVVLLAIVGTWKNRRLAVWTWLPIAMLSCLPHKESRYLIPIVPFLSIAAALGAEKLIRAATSGERAAYAGRTCSPEPLKRPRIDWTTT